MQAAAIRHPWPDRSPFQPPGLRWLEAVRLPPVRAVPLQGRSWGSSLCRSCSWASNLSASPITAQRSPRRAQSDFCCGLDFRGRESVAAARLCASRYVQAACCVMSKTTAAIPVAVAVLSRSYYTPLCFQPFTKDSLVPASPQVVPLPRSRLEANAGHLHGSVFVPFLLDVRRSMA